MAAGINKIIIVGNLGRDPEVRYSQGGMAICNFSVAVTERVKDGESWKDTTEWFRVVTFGKTAENAAQYLQKGRQVYVEGRLKTSKYKDKDGVEKTSTEVVCNQLTFLGANPDKGDRFEGSGASPSERKANAAKKAGVSPTSPANSAFDDDLPF